MVIGQRNIFNKIYLSQIKTKKSPSPIPFLPYEQTDRLTNILMQSSFAVKKREGAEYE